MAESKDPSYIPPWSRDQVPSWPTPTSSGGGQRFYERDHAEIYQKLSSHAHEWRKIGRGLGFSTNEMDIIASTPMLFLRGSMGYLEQLLSQWLQWAPGDGRGSKGFATKESLIAGLLKVNLGGLAAKFGYTESSKSPSAEPTPATIAKLQQEQPRYGSDDMNKVRREKQPQLPSDDTKEAVEKFASEAAILLHTVKNEELFAVFKHLKPPPVGDHSSVIIHQPDENTKLYLGIFGGRNVAVIQTSKGADCRQHIQFALESLTNVQIVIAIGFAYGRKEKCALGDILVSTSILAVSNCRGENGAFNIDESSGSIVKMTTRTHNTFALNQWTQFCCNQNEDRESQVRPGLIISGSILWNDENLLQKLKEKHDRFIGGEMEAQELAQIAFYLKSSKNRDVEFIVIKGVADFGDGSKTNEWQYTASIAAATHAENSLKVSGKVVYQLPAERQD